MNFHQEKMKRKAKAYNIYAFELSIYRLCIIFRRNGMLKGRFAKACNNHELASFNGIFEIKTPQTHTHTQIQSLYFHRYVLHWGRIAHVAALLQNQHPKLKLLCMAFPSNSSLILSYTVCMSMFTFLLPFVCTQRIFNNCVAFFSSFFFLSFFLAILIPMSVFQMYICMCIWSWSMRQKENSNKRCFGKKKSEKSFLIHWADGYLWKSSMCLNGIRAQLASQKISFQFASVSVLFSIFFFIHFNDCNLHFLCNHFISAFLIICPLYILRVFVLFNLKLYPINKRTIYLFVCVCARSSCCILTET